MGCTYNMLVGGLEHEFYFSIYIGNVIIPTDFHIFQRGRYTTNQLYIYIYGSYLKMALIEIDGLPIKNGDFL